METWLFETLDLVTATATVSGVVMLTMRQFRPYVYWYIVHSFAARYAFLTELIIRQATARSEEQGATRSYLLDLFLPIAVSNDAQASISDMMPEWIEAHGFKKAQRIRRWQSVRIVFGHHALPVLGFFERLLTILRGAGPAS